MLHKHFQSTQKILKIVFLFCLLAPQTWAQQFGNEWINFQQTYYKIPIIQDGVYRLSQADLSAAGISGVNPRHFQLYHRGIEHAIFINGEEDNSFDAGDYIEFYGKRNDGTLDADPFMYNPISRQVNKYYNLHSDTTAYFLTWTLDGTLGKRMETLNEPYLNTPAPFHWKEELLVFSDEYSIGQNFPASSPTDIYNSIFDTGEGWASTLIGNGQSRNFSIPINNPYNQAGVNPMLEIVMVGGVKQANYSVEVRVGNAINNLRTLPNTANGNLFNKTTFNATLTFNDINGTGNFILRLTAAQGGVRIAYIKLIYPQNPTLQNANRSIIGIPNNAGNLTYLSLANPPANARILDIGKQDAVRRINYNLAGGNLQFALSSTTPTVANPPIQNTLLIDNGAFLSPAFGIRPVSFQALEPALHNYLIVSHPKLRTPIAGVNDAVAAYSAYRASPAGGNYQPLIVNIDQLYDQFSFGEKTPLALRRFAKYMYAGGEPKFLFLIGSSISFPDQYFKPGIDFFVDKRKDFSASQKDLVPTSGFPPSDNRYTQGLSNLVTNEILIPVGRLPTSEPQDVLKYLNKVIEHEAENCNTALWQKHALHLSGGVNEVEQSFFKGILANLAVFFTDTFSNPPLPPLSLGGQIGGKVFSQSKSTNSPSEVVNVAENVNNGVGLITFSGHAAIGITDLEIGFVSDPTQGYNNQGKYPLMLTVGCQLGSVFYDTPSFSKDWLFTANKGSIAFLGHTYLAFSGPGNQYMLNLYRTAFTNPAFLGKSIGEIIANVSRTFPTSAGNPSHLEQFLLQGDPAVKLFKNFQPDFAIESISLESIDGNTVSDITEAFQLRLIVSNFGSIDEQKRNFSVKITRTYANGDISTFSTEASYSTIFYQDTLFIPIFREEGRSAFGLNTFEVSIDAHHEDEALDDQIEECNELNNTAIFQYLIPTFGVLPITPTEYSIASSQPLTLSAFISNSDNFNREVIFEIDTVATYNSPAKQSFISPPSQSPSWTLNLLSDNDQDSTVYYWRVNLASAVNDPAILWGESSFTYIKDSPSGWSQRQFPQFSKARLSNVKRNTEEEIWEFISELDRNLVVRTYGNAFTPNLPYIYFRYAGDTYISSDNVCGEGMIAYRFTETGQIAAPLSNATPCGRNELGTFLSNEDIANGRLATYLNQASENEFILLFTVGTVDFSTWTSTQFALLQSIGGNPNLYSSLANGHPYAIFGKKSYTSGEAVEAIAFDAPLSSEIVLNPALAILKSEGQIVSTLIGPAQDWGEIIHRIDRETEDNYQLDAFGVNFLGQESPTPLIENITQNVLPINEIDATAYPYLRLKLKVNDAIQRTPPQLKQWTVLYEGAPEGIMDAEAAGFNAYQILPQSEGARIPLNFVFRNISNRNYNGDSLVVEFKINGTLLKSYKIKAPLANEFTQFRDTIATLGLSGTNQLCVFVNPPTSPEVLPEARYENNLLCIDFEISQDRRNPILEVAFDGKRIMDGEVVAPEPLIGIVVRDENTFLANEPSSISFALKKPCEGCDFEEIDLAQNNQSWSFENGVLKVDFKPEPLQDGIHTLKVQGTDAAGNRAGTEPYLINFEVVSESSVTNFYPYPNPFSTNTRFVFTLTGAEIPSEMKIQIMTVSGKVVREITQDEIGAIRIGNNLTEYAWDGRDEFGDVLANGVYIYRVVMGNTQNVMKARATAGDKAFKNGYGKLYILR